MTPSLALIVLASVLAGCASSKERPLSWSDGQPVVGCYRLSSGQWTPPFPQSVRLGSVAPPSSLQFHTTGDITPTWQLFAPPVGGVRGAWRLVRADSMVIVWDAGEVGVEMMLRPQGDSLVGQAVFRVWGGGEPIPPSSAPLTALHISCG